MGSFLGFLIIFFLVAVGIPSLNGGVLHNVAPGIGTLAPDAVSQAIAQHPEWEASQKLYAIGIGTAVAAAPETYIRTAFPAETTSGFWPTTFFAALYWCEQFCPHNLKVDMVAGFIESSVDPQAAEKSCNRKEGQARRDCLRRLSE